jgi:hypothetical protein
VVASNAKAGLALGLFWAFACASSSNSSGGSGGAGGVSGSGVGIGSTSTTGSSTTGAGGSSNPNPGTFDSIWKRQSALVQAFDPSNPVPTNQTITLPATITDPVDGREIDVYQTIQNDTLVSHSYRIGDGAYYRILQPVTKVDDQYLGSFDDSSHIFSLKDGRLEDQTSIVLGSAVFTSSATYQKYDGPLPPTTWPAQVIEIK